MHCWTVGFNPPDPNAEGNTNLGGIEVRGGGDPGDAAVRCGMGTIHDGPAPSAPMTHTPGYGMGWGAGIITSSQLYRILRTGRQELAQKIDIDGRTFASNRTIVRVDGETIGAVAVLQDISELESISRELKHTQRITTELEAIIESSYDGIYVTDDQACTLRVNSAYERITGIPRKEVIGRTMYELVDAGFFNESVTVRVLETGQPTSIIQHIKTGKTVMVTGNPFYDDRHNIDLVVTNVRDVSELHRLQQRLETSEKQLHEAEVELRQLRGTLRGKNKMVLRSNKMQELVRTALRLSHVESTVLIQGASGVGKEIFADLLAYDWPGNVRELENLIEQLVVVTPGEIITEAHLPSRWDRTMDCTPLAAIGQRPLGEIMAEVERNLLQIRDPQKGWFRKKLAPFLVGCPQFHSDNKGAPRTMMNAKQYEESLRKLNLNVYMFGERIDNVVDHPIIRPSMNAVALTYELAHDPEHEDLMTAVSHLSGKRINRFTHIHQSVSGLVKKSKMGRLMGSKTGCCFQRCVGMDALNALSMTTFDMDRQLGTGYNKRFIDYLAYVQENDLTCDGAMTDPKGDRSLPPHRQADPDLFLHVVEEKADGIVVRGAKAHQTGAVNSHEVIVMPTITMRPRTPITRFRSPCRPMPRASPTSWEGRAVTRASWKAGPSMWATSISAATRPWWSSTMFSCPGSGSSCTRRSPFPGSWSSSSPPTIARVTPARWAWATCLSARPRPLPTTTGRPGHPTSRTS